MRSSALLSGFAAVVLHGLAALAAPADAAADGHHALPACSERDIGNCTCPSGTQYQASTTYAVIGTNAQTFQKLYGSFYNVGWLQANLTSSTGPDNTVGSIRVISSGSLVGTYEYVEKLIAYSSQPDGGFLQRFSLVDPIEYNSHNGSFAGYWVTLQTEYWGGNETLVKFDAYACFTGHPLPFATFRAGALQGVEATLKSKGLLTGVDVPPYSNQTF